MSSQSKAFHLINLGESVKLPQTLPNDGIVIFRSSSLNLKPIQTNKTDGTNINLLNSKDDKVLHISIRRTEGDLVLNAQPANGSWGSEERVPLKGLFDGNNTTITVYVHPDFFQVIVNGKTVHYFKKRIQGDITSFAYYADEVKNPALSSTIAAETYQNWAALVPGSN